MTAIADFLPRFNFSLSHPSCVHLINSLSGTALPGGASWRCRLERQAASFWFYRDSPGRLVSPWMQEAPKTNRPGISTRHPQPAQEEKRLGSRVAGAPASSLTLDGHPPSGAHSRNWWDVGGDSSCCLLLGAAGGWGGGVAASFHFVLPADTGPPTWFCCYMAFPLSLSTCLNILCTLVF